MLLVSAVSSSELVRSRFLSSCLLPFLKILLDPGKVVFVFHSSRHLSSSCSSSDDDNGHIENVLVKAYFEAREFLGNLQGWYVRPRGGIARFSKAKQKVCSSSSQISSESSCLSQWLRP